MIQVSGRLYPVEHPLAAVRGEPRRTTSNDAIADAVDELWRGRRAAGDVLVFLPGEREIRDAAEHLRKHHPPGVEIAAAVRAPVASRSRTRVFEPHSARRIVLATNVAETSLTVPGIRYVIDAGLARIKRYSFRSKVEQLPIEPISQAAANQRAGRCGRVADGICIRLYDEADFAGAAALHRPGDPALVAGRRDPAHEVAATSARSRTSRSSSRRRSAPIADGYQLLTSSARSTSDNELTPIGRELAKLPLDPRVGRMILEAREREALREVLVIASALSVQDVRDRPLEQQQAADQAHKKFDDEKSEFLGTLKLWKWLESSRGGHGEHRALATASTSSCCATTSSRRAACASGATSIRSCTRWSPSTAGALNAHAGRPTSRCTCRCSPACSATSA